MQPRISSLIAKALLAIAVATLAWNLRNDTTDDPRESINVPAPSRHHPQTSRDLSSAPVAQRADISASESDRRAAAELAAELDAAIEHGLDPGGLDARTYAEAISVLRGEAVARRD